MMTEKIYIQINDERKEAKGEELDYILETQAEMTQQQKNEEKKAAEEAKAKESANAKLIALGLTEAEVEALKG
jgi:hypothetical protein